MSELPNLDRIKIWRILCQLSPEIFDEVLIALNVPMHVIPGDNASQGKRVFAVFRWADSSTGCGLISL